MKREKISKYSKCLIILLLAACTRTVVARPQVDLPPFPALPVCVQANLLAAPIGESLTLDRDAWEAYREALARERVCRVEREALTEAWGRKVLNRLKAVTEP